MCSALPDPFCRSRCRRQHRLTLSASRSFPSRRPRLPAVPPTLPRSPQRARFSQRCSFFPSSNVYQRLTSTVPISLTLSAPTAPGASIAVVELNGTVDWWVNGRSPPHSCVCLDACLDSHSRRPRCQVTRHGPRHHCALSALAQHLPALGSPPASRFWSVARRF